MTTIVYRDGILAGDSRAYAGDKMPIGSKVKVRRTNSGWLIGASSTVVGGTDEVMRWFEQGQPNNFNFPEHFTFLGVDPNGKGFIAVGAGFLSGPLEGDFFAIGSGEQYAQGALLMGATAIEACRAACIADVWSDLPIFAVSHDSDDVTRIDE